MTIDAFAFTQFFLTHSVDSNFKVQVVETRLGLSDVFDQPNLNNPDVNSGLQMRQSVTVSKTVNVSASNTLEFAMDSQPRVNMESLSQSLPLWHQLVNEYLWPLTSNHLALSHSATYISATGINQTLTMTQTVSVSKTKVCVVESTFLVAEGANVYKPDKNWILGS